MPLSGLLTKSFHLAVILGNLLRLTFSWLLRGAFQRPAPQNAPKRILVLAYTAVGDSIFLLPALQALRRGLPDAHITCLGNSYPSTAELLPATDVADEFWTIEAPYGYHQAPAPMLRKIREGRFDAVLVSLPASARFFGSSLFSIPLRVGHCRPIEAPHTGWSWPRYALWRLRRGIIAEEFERRLIFNSKVWVREDDEHMTTRNLRLVQALGLSTPEAATCRPALPRADEAIVFADQVLKPAPRERTVGLHIGSPHSQYAKVWAPERWGAVCRELAATDRLRVVLLGGPDEAELPARFESAFQGPYVNMVGRCGLLKSLELIRRCDLFLGNDTGLSKAAMALGVPTVAVWGPSDRPGYGIVWNPERHLEIHHQLPCSPCIRMGLRNEGDGVINFANCGHRACLNELSVQEVVDSIRRRYQPLLSQNGPKPPSAFGS